MADFFVKNLTNPITSVNELGVHVIGNAATDAYAAYANLHPVTNGDQLRCVPAASVLLATAAPGPQVFNSVTLTIPPIGS